MESEQQLGLIQQDKPETAQLSLFRIISAILLTNAAGITLKYFGLDTYFVFLGFRFHLSAVLPFLLLPFGKNFHTSFEAIKKPLFKLKFLPILWLIISLAVLLATLRLLNKIELGDPDYFSEFGLSSIFDFPLYLIWNFPQLCFLFMTLLFISRLSKLHFLNAFIGCILLFAYEFIPFNLEISIPEIITFILISITACFFVTRLQNIYWFAIVIFSSVWSIVLLFGSSSAAIINIFFAREYNSWEGFFKSSKTLNIYIIPSFFSILFVIVFLYAILKRKSGDEGNSPV